MPPSGYFIDSNLLLLFVVGSEDPELISRHRRLDGYSADDFDLLSVLISETDQVFVTPNTLTETSNLLGQHGDPQRIILFGRLREIINESREIVISSAIASDNEAFQRLGLTDSVLLEVVNAETPLLTVDFRLYVAALTECGWRCRG